MPGKIHITPDGAQSLRSELATLWKETRPEVTQAVKEAAALGDRSENADYIYGKKRLREIDKRIRYLQKRLDDLEIVDRVPPVAMLLAPPAIEGPAAPAHPQPEGAEDEEGSESTIRIVGVDELDLDKGWVSLASPMAKSLLGKYEGDDVRVHRPAGDTTMHILKVSYTAL